MRGSDTLWFQVYWPPSETFQTLRRNGDGTLVCPQLSKSCREASWHACLLGPGHYQGASLRELVVGVGAGWRQYRSWGVWCLGLRGKLDIQGGSPAVQRHWLGSQEGAWSTAQSDS